MSYDSPDFRVQMMAGPYHATFSTLVYTVAETDVTTHTAEDDRNKIEFFRNIKVLGFKVMPLIAPTTGALAAGCTVRYKLMVGSDVVATAAVTSTSTAKGVMVEGGVATGTNAEVTSNEEMVLALVYTSGAGTDNTMAAHSVEGYVLYEHRFA